MNTGWDYYFDRTRKPLASAVGTRSMGIQSILGWKLLQRRDLCENLLIDARQCNVPAVHRSRIREQDLRRLLEKVDRAVTQ
jgi:hypothetical protein